MVLKGCFQRGSIMCTLWESSIFGVRAGFGMDVSHVFPQSVLAVIPLLGGVIGVYRACAECEAVLPLFSMAITALLGWG